VRLLIAVVGTTLAAGFFLLASINGPASAQQPDPGPTPTATPTATPTVTPTPTPTPVTKVPSACPGWQAFHKTVRSPFSVGKLRATATVTIVDGLMSVKVKVTGKLRRPVKKLTLSGRLVHRNLSTLKFTPFKSFRGRDKRDTGTRRVKWTFAPKGWCLPPQERTEVWQLRLHARLKAVRQSGRNDIMEPFPVVPPVAAS
jgi:hypothetical protein